MTTLENETTLNCAQFSETKVFFDPEIIKQPLCGCCWQRGDLISPCNCELRYHQSCLLRYILEQFSRRLANQTNLNSFSCMACQYKFNLVFDVRTRFEPCRLRSSLNCKTITALVWIGVILSLCIITETLFGVGNTIKHLFITLSFSLSIFIIFLTSTLFLLFCCRRYAMTTQLVLQKVKQRVDTDSQRPLLIPSLPINRILIEQILS